MIRHELKAMIDEFRKVSLQPDFLNSRTQSESFAKQLINSRCGNLNKTELERLLILCNTERVPPNINTYELAKKDTCTRFRLSFIGANKKNIITDLESCNKWISTLWNTTDDMNTLKMFWKEGSIKGAGIGFPTMILYLKNPSKYNVWIPFLSNALKILTGKDIELKKDIKNYIEYNTVINTIFMRDIFTPGIKPQEIDYIIFRFGLIKNCSLTTGWS